MFTPTGKGSPSEACETAAPHMTRMSPIAATGVSTSAVPVSQGATRPTTAISSQTATRRTTGTGNGAMPVWPVASRRSRDIVDFATPEMVKTASRGTVRIHTMTFMPLRTRQRRRP